MDDFDKELEALTDALKDDEHEQAARRLFEESQLWNDHRKWHEQQGTPARMELWEEPAKQQPAPTPEEPAPRQKMIPVAGCACQHHNPLLKFEEGQITPGMPQQVTVTPYGAAPTSSTTYSDNQVTQDTTYTKSSGTTKDLYR